MSALRRAEAAWSRVDDRLPATVSVLLVMVAALLPVFGSAAVLFLVVEALR